MRGLTGLRFSFHWVTLIVLFYNQANPVWAQNLVPNGSFETITDCKPIDVNFRQVLPVSKAAPWFSVSDPPALLNNPCLPFYNVDNPGVPILGNTGKGWVWVAGGVDKTDPLNEDRMSSHSLSIALLRPLEAGKTYCFSSYIRVQYLLYLVKDPDESKSTYQNVQGFGAYFSTNVPVSQGNKVLRVTPQIVNRNLYTTAWAPFQRCYRAVGGEKYLTLGFFAKELAQYKNAALFLDDVSLRLLDEQVLGADTSFCAGSSVLLRATFPCAKSYRWSTGSTDSTLRVSQAGTYSVRVQTDCGDISDTIRVRERRNELDLGPDMTLCAGQSRTLLAPPSASLIRWQDDSNQPTLPVSEPGTYWAFTVQDGCEKRDEIVLRRLDAPKLMLTPDTTRCDDGSPMLLQADTTTNSANRYRWSDGSTSPRLSVNEAGTYSVEATNACGTARASVQLRVSPCPCAVHWPDAFTPNNDGVNDRLTGYVDCQYRPIKSVVWQVYNRWGEVVYQSGALLPGWDGSYRGELCVPGVYTYKLTIATERESKPYTEVVTGRVRLIR